MNKIYKIMKNNSTGCMVVVSELAKGGKKGNKLKLASCLLLATLSYQSEATEIISQDFNAKDNSHKAGEIIISNTVDNIDLGLGKGFSGIQKGEEVKQHTITTQETISSLYKIKYTDVNNAVNHLTQITNNFNNGIATQADLDSAKNMLQQAQDKASAISDSKFMVNDPNNLIGNNSEGTEISEKQLKYKDPVSDKTFEITVKDNLVKTGGRNDIHGLGVSVNFYEKTDNDVQYDEMELIKVVGNGTDITVENSINNTLNNQITAISKNGSAVIRIEDGANLTFDTNISYYTGGGRSTSQEFIEQNQYQSKLSTSLYKVNYKGDVNTILGVRSINSESDFNLFNQELISYIQNNEQLRLDYPSQEKMQSFYDAQIAGLYTVSSVGSYEVKYVLTKEELAELAKEQGLEDAFNNKVTLADSKTDVGLKTTHNNHFVGIDSSGSIITVNENSTIDNYIAGQGISDGSVIRADFSNSGINGNNIINVDGVINAHGLDVIRANNAEVYVSDTGIINGNINVYGPGNFGVSSGNIIKNAGNITGKIITENSHISNLTGAIIGSIESLDEVHIINSLGAKIAGKVTIGNNGSIDNIGSINDSITTGSDSNITNQSGGIINGSIITKTSSHVTNDNNANISGSVVITGNSSTFDNNGVVGGSSSTDGAISTNNNLIIGNNVVNLKTNSTLTNNGDIYVGYTYNNSTNTKAIASNNNDAYSAIDITDLNTQLINNKTIHVSSSQHDINVISIKNGSEYVDTVNSNIVLNEENSIIQNVDKDKGNNNTIIYVAGNNTATDIKGTLTLNDAGSSALLVKDQGKITLSGTVNLNSKNIYDSNTNQSSQVRSFGAWIEGDGARFTMKDNAQIHLNADRAIGVHIRDGATAEIDDHAGIVFSDKQNQIGFLISGITQPASLIYNSDKKLLLSGEGSVLFRIERGSIFNSNTIASQTPSLSVLDSNNTKNSTLMKITNGATSTGTSNQTIANLSGFTLNINGENAKGISVEGGAQVKITDDTKILLTGDNSILAQIDGNYYDINGVNIATSNGNSYVESSANLTTDITAATNQMVSGKNSIGYYITNSGRLAHKGSVDFKEPSQNNIGVKIDSGGTLTSQSGSYIKVIGTAVEISGSSSLATIINAENGSNPVIWAIGSQTSNSDAAYHVKDQARLKLTGDGITKAEGTAHGILVDGASKIILDNTKIALYNNDGISSSSGNGIENRSSLNNIQFVNGAVIDVNDGYGIHSSVGFLQTVSDKTSGIINVYGQGTGIRFEQIDSLTGNVLGTTDNSINNTGYEKVIINVLQNTGHGIYVDSNKSVNTSASVNIISNIGRSALEIKGSTNTASQSGNLHTANNDSVIVDLNNGFVDTFTNDGELLFGDFSQNNLNEYQFTAQDKSVAKNSYAIKTQTNENALSFTNGSNGKINGTVELLGYGNSLDPNDTSKGNTFVLQGEGNIFRAGIGDDQFIIHSGSGDDSGGENQLKQFTSIDGGQGNNQITFTSGANFTITKDETIKNIQYLGLNNASNISFRNLNTSDGLNSGIETYDIVDKASKLTYQWANSNTLFDRTLKGEGTFIVDLQPMSRMNSSLNEFAFNNSANVGDFTGTLNLSNLKFTLLDTAEHLNTSALANATLNASNNSYVIIGAGEQNIKGLTISGGTLNFGNIDLRDNTSANHVSVNDLILEQGNIEIDVTGSIYNPTIPSSLPILEQDDGIIFTKLVSANNISGSAINLDIDRSKIKLIDNDGNEITEEAVSHLIQNSQVVARATYDSRITKGSNNDGLYVGYGLTKVELNAKNDLNGNAFILDATNSNQAKAGSQELDAIITDYVNSDGTLTYGDLQIRGDKSVTLSSTNTYHGSTFIKDSSTLISGANNSLGLTRLLKLDSNTKYTLNGWDQTLGSIYTSNNSLVDINNGQLMINGIDGTDSTAALSSYLSAGSLIGAGQLIVGDPSSIRTTSPTANITIVGDNLGLTANVTNSVNGSINMDSQGGLGLSSLINDGELNLYMANDSVMSNSTISGNGTLNKYNLASLTFTLPQAKNYTGTTSIKGGSLIFKGNNSATTDSYATHLVDIERNGTLVGLDNAIFQGNINNSGRFYIGESPNSNRVSQHNVTVNNYVGTAESRLIFNGKLSDDNSPISKLIINGDSSGTSYVLVNNIAGLGAKTMNGIEIIDVNGQSNAEFIQSERIIAGAYDYILQRSTTNNNNWVLQSQLAVRPEIGGYIGNMFAANNLFNSRLYDRLGETQYTDLLTGEQKVTSMWLRYQYGYNKFEAADGDLSIKNNWNLTQIGGDIAGWSTNGLNRLHIGVMAGQGRSKNDSKSNRDNTKSDAKIDGYSVGLYATWYNNNEDKTGLYIDSWALWNHFNATVSGDNFSEKYHLKGMTASIESGYSLATGTLGHYDVWLQPKAQMIWGGVKANDFTESNGTRISSNDGNLQTRLGLRASLISKLDMQEMTNQSAQLFIEANWLHNTKLFDVTLDNDMTVSQDSARNIGELKVGVEGNIHKNTNIWFNLAGQRGDHNYENASIMLGLKYSF
ncbi:autotransporter outer membrane beta-barrel domain-containing protein [Orbus wheelerorum]|uniref:autotransporter outer membrane beta-barrel domain-containing protein n=1 Tax=Orbus wheelerorum TaxID=3074111 RepID=UPI00370D09DC